VWALTKQDALAHGTADDKSAEGLANYPVTFTVVMEKGSWKMFDTISDTEDGQGTFTVTGNRVDLHESGSVLSFTFKTDDNGTLHLIAIPPMDPQTQYILTTERGPRSRVSGDPPVP
jgi:hypothetical protein